MFGIDNFLILMYMPYILFFLFIIIFRFFIKKFFFKKRIINVDNSYYYRDIPCAGNIEFAYWLLYNFSNIDKMKLNNGLIGAYLLTWYKKGYININSSGKKYVVDLKNGNFPKGDFEDYLYTFLKNCAGNNNTLEKNEIERYCRVDTGDFKFKYMFETLLDEVENILVSNNEIYVVQEKNYIIFKTSKKITLSDKLNNEYKNLIGLKNFLLDFSCIDDKRYIQVHLWEEYLIFANIFGIADKVQEQFKKIYPGYNAVDNLFNIDSDNTLVGTIDRAFNRYLVVLAFVVVFIILYILVKKSVILTLILLLVFILSIPFYLLFKPYIDNKQVKEMDGKTYAKITNVSSSKSVSYEDGKQVTVTYYRVDYEYFVNNVSYFGIDTFQKVIPPKIGNKIKIYYNKMKPEKSETAINHNEFLWMFIIILGIILFTLLFVFLNIDELQSIEYYLKNLV